MAKAHPDIMDKTDPHFAFKYMAQTAPDPPSIGQSAPMASRPWLYVYLPVAWAGHLCLGLAIGVLGPLQPYLARQVGVESREINFIWTGRAFGNCLAAVVTGAVFRRFVTLPWQKLLFLSSCLLVSGSFGFLVPWVSHIHLLCLALLIVGFFIGSFNTANTSLVVYMFGPHKSPPIVQSLNAFIGAGFLLSSLLVRPFFPALSSQSVCDSVTVTDFPSDYVTVTELPTDYVTVTEVLPAVMNTTSDSGAVHLPDLAWPFMLIAGAHLVPVLGFLVIIACRLVMPRHQQVVADMKTAQGSVRNPNIVLVLGFLFFVLSCGIESSFQSQSFTFALCGPHKMTAQQAASLTTVFCLSFLLGRFSGVLLSARLQPRTCVLATNIGCLLSAVLLSSTAGWSSTCLYLGTAAMGAAISMQIGSGYSWLAEQMDLTGARGSAVFLGANAGWLVTPPLAGRVIFSGPGGVGLYLLCTGIAAAQLGVILVMWKLSTSKK